VPEVCKLKAQSSRQKKGIIPDLYFQLSALNFQPKLRPAALLLNEIVQEKIPKLELLRITCESASLKKPLPLV
jgi:hypothetical protein